jgi:hypothetical protein
MVDISERDQGSIPVAKIQECLKTRLSAGFLLYLVSVIE